MVGVTVETYRRGAHADFLSPYRAWTEEERTLAMQHIRHLYQLFVATVAEGRAGAGAGPGRPDGRTLDGDRRSGAPRPRPGRPRPAPRSDLAARRPPGL